MKQYTKTVSIQFSVEHVSDNPEYERLLSDAVNRIIYDIGTQFGTQLQERQLMSSIVAGGVSVQVQDINPDMVDTI